MGGTTIGAVASCISQSSVGDDCIFAPPCPAFHVGVSASACLSVSQCTTFPLPLHTYGQQHIAAAGCRS